MTGYKLGDKNQVNIDYGLKVLREDGSLAYEQPEAATQKIQTFYPQRYQPGELKPESRQGPAARQVHDCTYCPRSHREPNLRNAPNFFSRIATIACN